MKHIIEFKGENHSGYKDLNLLCNEDNIYIMDNHNVAMWCWLQKIDLLEKYSIIHIDRHHDTRDNHIDLWIKNIPENINKIDIADYLSLKYREPNFNENTEIMQWDTYLSTFHRLYGLKCIKKYHFFTHDENALATEMKSQTIEYQIDKNFKEVKRLLDNDCEKNKWIVNIDLDYFFTEDAKSVNIIRFFTDDQINSLVTLIMKYIRSKIAVLTIALSPEYCYNWNQAKDTLKLFEKKLNFQVFK